MGSLDSGRFEFQLEINRIQEWWEIQLFWSDGLNYRWYDLRQKTD